MSGVSGELKLPLRVRLRTEKPIAAVCSCVMLAAKECEIEGGIRCGVDGLANMFKKGSRNVEKDRCRKKEGKGNRREESNVGCAFLLFDVKAKKAGQPAFTQKQATRAGATLSGSQVFGTYCG